MPDFFESDQDIQILVDILASWTTFKERHDLKSPKLRCCDDTQALFDALNAYEKLMTNDGKDPL